MICRDMTFYNEYEKVWVAVDVIIFGFDDGKLKILIGRRQMDPGRGEWSLYGGFVGNNESVDEAAERDPGERVVSIAYYALINVADYDEQLRLEHGLEWVDVKHIPTLYSDHNDMTQQALKKMRQKIKTEPISFRLLPPLFTLTQLQKLYEAVQGEEVDKRNFRKRVKEMDFIEKTELIDKSHSKRGAALYRFNRRTYNEDPNFKL